MTEILSFLAAHWTEWFFAGMSLILAKGYHHMSGELAKQQKKNKATQDGVEALLRDSIVAAYNKYSEKGYCPIYAKEALKSAYKAYHELGGNDVATKLYDKLLTMDEDGKE